ncbi:MAG: hypothetical protein RLZZ65_364 [Bacteroidota bacterium]|jgi:O-antigen ligase
MIFEKVYYYCCLALFTIWLPFPKMGSLLIALFGVVVLWGIFQKKLRFELNSTLVAFSALYALYAVYILNSPYLEQETKFLEYKLSFLAFPILFSFKPSFILERKKIMEFVLGAIFLLGLLYIGHAIFQYFLHHDTQVFHSSWFAYNHHPSYAAVFFSFAIFYLLETFSERSGKQKWLAIGLLIFFTFLHIPLESMAGLLFLALVYAFFIVKSILQYLSYRKIAALIVGLIIFVFAMLRIQPGLKTDLINTQKSSIAFLADPQEFVNECPQKMSGNQARLILWTTNSEIISKHPLGVGISGLDIEMSRKFHQLGFHELAAKHWNPHNQFLQITAELGWLGLLLFLVILFRIARMAWQRKDLLLGFLVTSLIFNSLFESMLQRQSGIIFYLLFLSAFISILTLQKPKEA